MIVAFALGVVVGATAAGNIGYRLAFRWLGAYDKDKRRRDIRNHRKTRILP
jgi:hypothetical protein